MNIIICKLIFCIFIGHSVVNYIKMEKFKKLVKNISRKAVFLLIGLICLLGAKTMNAQQVGYFPDQSTPTVLMFYCAGINNPCPNQSYYEIHYKIQNYHADWINLPNAHIQQAFTISLDPVHSGNTITINFELVSWYNQYCIRTEYLDLVCAVPCQPVSNFRASDSIYQHKVDLTWAIQESSGQYSYMIYRNGVGIATLPAGSTTYTDTGLGEGWVYDYQIQCFRDGVAQGVIPTSSPEKGYTHNPRFTATNFANRVELRWNSYAKVNAPTGYTIHRSGDGITAAGVINQLSGPNLTGYNDEYSSTSSIIPGYTYQYTFNVDPFGVDTYENDILATTTGKVLPNGTISGSVKTPDPGGVGIPGVQIVATLQGAPLPTDGTTTYTATTDANGNYTIPNIYYYNTAQFNVVPSSPGRNFDPAQTLVTLDLAGPNEANINFKDTSSYILSGTVTQGGCPRAGVHMLLDNDSTHVITDSLGNYDVTVPTGGNYTLKPALDNHTFSPAQRDVTVLSDMSVPNFSDTKQYTLTGRFKASCNTSIGTATLKFKATSTGQNVCDSVIVTTDANGYYAVVLPARNYHLQLLHFTSINQQILDSIDVLGYFWNMPDLDLTCYDTLSFHHDTTTLDFTYIEEPQLVMTGLSPYITCLPEETPIMQQGIEMTVKFIPQESFNGVSCPADDGFIVISENISSDSVNVKTDTIYYVYGDTISYSLTPGYPNIVPPYKKFIQAILFGGSQTDTVYTDVIVIGYKPRHATFTTVSPQLPFYILHNPPGDNSYSYLEENTTITNTFSQSYQTEASVGAYFAIHAGPVVSVEAGFLGTGSSVELAAIDDATISVEAGASVIDNSATSISTTTSQRFQTSGNSDIVGGAGDVYVGGAMNLIYAVSDGILYDFDSCKIDLSKTLWMQPNGFATKYMYTEGHITDYIIPELQSLSSILLSATNHQDSLHAKEYQNQMHIWQQLIDANHADIDSAEIESNITFSNGLYYESSLEAEQTANTSIDFSYYLDAGVLLEIGASVGGLGYSAGCEAKCRYTVGTAYTNEISTANTVGYVLSDDDPGDSYTVDILKDRVFGVPAFKLVAGKSSCPYEEGTLPREGLQLISNTYAQSVEESQEAVYYFQLGNLSQSGETMTYDLMFDHTSNPYGAHLSIGGSPIIGNVPYPYTIPVGSPATATITITKGPDSAYYDNLKFTLKSQCDDQISDDIYLSAHFYKEYDLTVAVNGSGITNVPAGVHAYQEHSQVILYASPIQGYVFQKWMVGSSVYGNQAITVTMDSNMTATAYFVQTTLPQYSLQVSVVGNGTTIPPVGTNYILEDSLATLAAYPDINNAFVKWVINGTDVFVPDTTITITGNTTAVAHFTETRRLTMLILQGEGQVTPTQGISNYPVGTSLHLYASPALGFVFEKWIIDSITYFTQNVDLTLTENVAAYAYFAPTSTPQFTLTMSAGNGGTTTPPAGQHFFFDGSTIALNAHPDHGKVFEKWEINSIETTVNPVNVTITGDVTVVAYFVDDESGIGDNTEVRNSANFYPNPSTGTVNVQSRINIDRILIYDIVGNLVYVQNEVNSSDYAMDLNYLNSGVYFVRLFTGSQSSVYRIQIIKK